jgi:cytochrome b561
VIFIALIALHIAAALKHWLIDRDGTLARMWSWRRVTPSDATQVI